MQNSCLKLILPVVIKKLFPKSPLPLQLDSLQQKIVYIPGYATLETKKDQYFALLPKPGISLLEYESKKILNKIKHISAKILIRTLQIKSKHTSRIYFILFVFFKFFLHSSNCFSY